MHGVIEPSPRRLDHSQRIEDLGPSALAADLLVNTSRLQELIDGRLAVVGFAVGQSGDVAGAGGQLRIARGSVCNLPCGLGNGSHRARRANVEKGQLEPARAFEGAPFTAGGHQVDPRVVKPPYRRAGHAARVEVSG